MRCSFLQVLVVTLSDGGYGGLVAFRDRRGFRDPVPRRVLRVVAMWTRRAWLAGFANPRAVLATSFAVRLCASAFAFERTVECA